MALRALRTAIDGWTIPMRMAEANSNVPSALVVIAKQLLVAK